jgi:hypothetical protein
VRAEAYPLTISWNVTKGTATYDVKAGNETRPMRGTGSMTVHSTDISRITVKLTSDGEVPKEFSLSQNYPNPFNPSTMIKYGLPVDSRVTVEIYNVIGQRIRTLISDNQTAGYHTAEWNGLNNDGQQLSSGIYFLRMSAKGANGTSFNEVRKMMLMK